MLMNSCAFAIVEAERVHGRRSVGGAIAPLSVLLPIVPVKHAPETESVAVSTPTTTLAPTPDKWLMTPPPLIRRPPESL